MRRNKHHPVTQHGCEAGVVVVIGGFHHVFVAHCAGRKMSLVAGLGRPHNKNAGCLDIRTKVVYDLKKCVTDGSANDVEYSYALNALVGEYQMPVKK